MRRLVSTLGALLLACIGAAQVAGVVSRPAFAQEKEEIAKTNLKVGDVAPDFTLLSNEWKPVKLSEFRGKKNVVLAFYVLAFTGG
jgi:cytochrome oxidase Cu insertion factor (SCO1/SenC/PrrC family)